MHESIDIVKEDLCVMPADAGNCGNNDTSSYRRYYFDNDRGTCLAFAYSGCGGNQNNFESDEICMQYCQNRKSEKN